MRAVDFIAQFPDGLTMPIALYKLAEYVEREKVFLPGKIQLITKGAALTTGAFDGDRATADQFTMFARDRVGSLFGYWRYEEQPLDRAPLVYLHSEGADSTVLANTLDEFLALLAVGHPRDSMFPAEEGEDDADEVEEEDGDNDADDTRQYREWLQAEMGIETPTRVEGHRIVEQARSAHPDFLEWLDRWANAHRRGA